MHHKGQQVRLGDQAVNGGVGREQQEDEDVRCPQAMAAYCCLGWAKGGKQTQVKHVNLFMEHLNLLWSMTITTSS
jgi:hypothetical protein